ncbi:LPXTG cell wall anchor domain-containing protein, partial [Ligilactobacillus equi]|uniref:LPXTG cell wall anchor domain-containing protein n=1 Tax=Ligilactobacillus equi TaxID=137357 RepID=UPI0005504673
KAVQNNFGVPYETNTVTNKVVKLDPKKDVIKNAGDSASINEKDVKLGDYIAYKLVSKELPENRATIVKNWFLTDNIDTKHDSVTRQYQVIANQDFTAANGSTVKANDDISRYFTFDYNADKGVLTVTPTAEYVALANSQANKAHKMSYTAFVQVQRIASGFVYNTVTDTLNNDADNSNQVWTFTYQPVDPVGKKKVTVGTAKDPNGKDNEGAKVVKGETLSYTLEGQPLVQYHETIKDFQVVDTFDGDVTYKGFKAFFKNNDGTFTDVTEMFNEDINGKQVTYSAEDALVKMMNSDQYNKVASSTPFIVAYVTVDHDGASIKNTYDVLLNGKIAVSNTTHNTSVKVNPTKSVLDQKNEDINGTNVLVGDTLKYSMT